MENVRGGADNDSVHYQYIYIYIYIYMTEIMIRSNELRI